MMVSLTGANMNRHTVENVQTAGWHMEYLENVGMGGIFKLMVACNR